MIFHSAFLNCHNFYKPYAHPRRFAGDQSAYDDKVRDLAAAIRTCRGGGLPRMVGLCEVGGFDEASDLLAAVERGRYSLEYQSPPSSKPNEPPQTGLAVAYDAELFMVEKVAVGETTLDIPRFHWFAVEFTLRPNGQRFWVVVNHWPADHRGYVRNEWLRMRLGGAVGEFYRNTASSAANAMLLMGDFNCEPFDDAMTGASKIKNRLVCVRERERVLRPGIDLNYFYNPTWSLIGARDDPQGTHCQGRDTPGAAWRCVDQLLLNPRFLRGGPARFVEDSLRVTMPHVGASDHGVISASFEYDPGP